MQLAIIQRLLSSRIQSAVHASCGLKETAYSAITGISAVYKIVISYTVAIITDSINSASCSVHQGKQYIQLLL